MYILNSNKAEKIIKTSYSLRFLLPDLRGALLGFLGFKGSARPLLILILLLALALGCFLRKRSASGSINDRSTNKLHR
jgi:hypothetical protein